MAIPPTIKLTAAIQVQETDYFCGAASAQSILAYRQVFRAQSTLYRHIRKFPTLDRGKNCMKWYSAPDSLKKILNYYLHKLNPANIRGKKFDLYVTSDRKALAKKLIWALRKFNIPCISLVKGGNHWIVVFGYLLDPATSDVQGFYVFDPIVGTTEEFIEYKQRWKLKFDTTVTQGRWNHKHIAIIDPDGKKRKPRKLPEVIPDLSGKRKSMFLNTSIQSKPEDPPVTPANPQTLNEIKPIKIFTKSPVDDTAKVVDIPTAKGYALWLLKPGGFYDPKMFKLYSANRNAAEPVMVQDLDSKELYYIVPIKYGTQKNYGLMCLAASDASHLESAFSTEIKRYFSFTPLSQKKIKSVIKSKYGKADVREMSIYPTLVWKYCRQSLTVYQPFHMITMGKTTVYIRIDGILFTKLSKSSR